MITAELRNWRRSHMGTFTILWGNVFGDTKGRFYDGTWIHTSIVRTIENKSDRLIVYTENSIYLCMKDQEYNSE